MKELERKGCLGHMSNGFVTAGGGAFSPFILQFIIFPVTGFGFL